MVNVRANGVSVIVVYSSVDVIVSVAGVSKSLFCFVYVQVIVHSSQAGNSTIVLLRDKRQHDN